MVDMEGHTAKKEKKIRQKVQFAMYGEGIREPKARKGKTRMTQFPVACVLHSLYEENHPNKLGISQCTCSQSVVPSASGSAVPGTC